MIILVRPEAIFYININSNMELLSFVDDTTILIPEPTVDSL